jgi:two-component SAPR family response regulator
VCLHPSGEALDLLTKVGEQYQPIAAEIACDLWEFQKQLSDAARSDDDDDVRSSLRRAVNIYGGDLLQGCDYPWVEPVREDFHHRAVDAHLRLAEHEQLAGHTTAAIEVLERAIDLDRYAEEPYRRLMTFHASCARPDAVTATWRLLNQRLGDLHLEVDAATVRLFRSITTTDVGTDDGPRPIRVLS